MTGLDLGRAGRTRLGGGAELLPARLRLLAPAGASSAGIDGVGDLEYRIVLTTRGGGVAMRRGVVSVFLACLAMAVLPLAADAANVSLSLTSPSPIVTSSGVANVQFDVNVDTAGCDPTKSFYIQIAIHNSAGQNAASSGPLYNDKGGPHSYIVTLPQGQKTAAYTAQATLYCPDTSTPAHQLAVDSVVVSFTVTRAGTGGVHCVVPNLVGKTLTRAKKLLGHAHCALGKVTAPKVAGGTKLVVRSSSPKAGTRLPKGAKVNVRLRRS